MKRLKSIDIFRGLSMIWMIIGHLSGWWLRDEDIWFAHLIFSILDPIGASAFIFIAGVSSVISLRNRYEKAQISNGYTIQQIKNEYMLRALIITSIALVYNTFNAIVIGDLKWIWSWFILLTISLSLFMAWPLYNTSKLFRICIAGIIWILNQVILILLLPYEGQSNIFGVFFHILYFPLDLDPILSFFPFFLIGTVIGDLIIDMYNIEDIQKQKEFLSKNFLYPCFLIGTFLIIFGIFFQLKLGYIFGHGHGRELIGFPDFLIRGSFSWMVYTLGILLILITTLLTLEIYGFFETEKSYRFLYYFSYYSLTVFLTHYLLYFVLLNQLTIFNIYIFIIITLILVWLLLRIIYFSKWKSYFSLKIQIGRISAYLARKIEIKKRSQI
ncbi:MAG: heparan-alpha-glucosaminide N-acetyltransferase domain-containing protein [Promethearchaeota archaeon]